MEPEAFVLGLVLAPLVIRGRVRSLHEVSQGVPSSEATFAGADTAPR